MEILLVSILGPILLCEWQLHPCQEAIITTVSYTKGIMRLQENRWKILYSCGSRIDSNESCIPWLQYRKIGNPYGQDMWPVAIPWKTEKHWQTQTHLYEWKDWCYKCSISLLHWPMRTLKKSHFARMQYFTSLHCTNKIYTYLKEKILLHSH